MKYLVRNESALFMKAREDIFEYLYNETLPVKFGYALCRDEVSKLAILPRGYRVVAELPEDDERTLDELIAEQEAQTNTETE